METFQKLVINTSTSAVDLNCGNISNFHMEDAPFVSRSGHLLSVPLAKSTDIRKPVSTVRNFPPYSFPTYQPTLPHTNVHNLGSHYIQINEMNSQLPYLAYSNSLAVKKYKIRWLYLDYYLLCPKATVETSTFIANTSLAINKQAEDNCFTVITWHCVQVSLLCSMRCTHWLESQLKHKTRYLLSHVAAVWHKALYSNLEGSG
jgi:hypothetical protein